MSGAAWLSEFSPPSKLIPINLYLNGKKKILLASPTPELDEVDIISISSDRDGPGALGAFDRQKIRGVLNGHAKPTVLKGSIDQGKDREPTETGIGLDVDQGV